MAKTYTAKFDGASLNAIMRVGRGEQEESEAWVDLKVTGTKDGQITKVVTAQPVKFWVVGVAGDPTTLPSGTELVFEDLDMDLQQACIELIQEHLGHLGLLED